MVIYEENGTEWATYMKYILTSHLQSDRILLYNMDFEEEDTLTFSRYRFKLLVLTNYLLESLNEKKSRVLFQLLHPSCSTVILLCGVHSLEGFYECVPLDKDSHVISTDQDPQDYISVLSSIMDKGCYDTSDYGHQSTSSEDAGLENREFVQIPKKLMPFPLILPQRILCENPGEICIILADEIPKNSAIEIEFCTEHQHVTRRYATQRNEKVLSVKAPDFPAGPVTINIWYGNTNKASMEIEYYTATREIKHLLMKVIDPIAFICQAFDVYSIEELDMVLTTSLQRKMFSREFNVYEISQHTNNGSCDEVPTLLHCAAKYGLKEVTLLLMQCQGADLISRITNKYGDDPAAIAEKYGHTHIQKMIQQFSRLKGTDDDIQVENLERQPQDVYVGMGPCAEWFCKDRPQENFTNGSKVDSQGNPVGDIKDKHELQHLHHNSSDEDLQLISKCVGNTVFFLKNEDLPDVLQGEKYITDIDADPLWVNINKSNNDGVEWESMENEYVPSSKYVQENISIPLFIEHDEEENQNEYKTLTDDLPLKCVDGMEDRTMINCAQEKSKGSDNENLCREEQLKYHEERNECKNKEPLIEQSTDSSLQTQLEPPPKPTIIQTAPEPSLSSTELETGISSIDPDNQEECDPENLICNKEGTHQEATDQEEGHTNQDYEKPVIFASTEDDAYIVFHTSIKHTPSTAHHPKVPEPSLTSGHQSTASYLDPGNQETDNPDSDNENISWDEQAKCPKEGNENDDDPLLLAVTHDDMYIEFQSKHIPVQQPPCPAYYSPAPEPSYSFELGRTISDIGQAAGEDANYENIYWDDSTDECTYSGEEDPYSLAYSDDSVYMEFPLETDDQTKEGTKTKRGTNSFIINRAPAPAPRPGGSATVKHGSYISQVFQQQERKMYGTVEHSAPTASDESQGSLQQYIPAGQDELILLQEKVKQGIITMDEALQKFHQWQNEKSGLDLLQQKKLQQLRDSIIGDKLEDEKLYDKITIVHQPNVLPSPQRTRLAAFDNSIYQRPLTPESPPVLYQPIKKHGGLQGKAPYGK